MVEIFLLWFNFLICLNFILGWGPYLMSCLDLVGHEVVMILEMETSCQGQWSKKVKEPGSSMVVCCPQTCSGSLIPESSTWTKMDLSYLSHCFLCCCYHHTVETYPTWNTSQSGINVEWRHKKSLFYLFLTYSLRKLLWRVCYKMRSLRKRERWDLGNGLPNLGECEVPPWWWREVPGLLGMALEPRSAGAEAEDFLSPHGGKATTYRMLRMSGFS